MGYGKKHGLKKVSGFKMAGMKFGEGTGSMLNKEEVSTDMDPVVVTPQMQKDRDMYNILNNKLNKNSFLEDDEARTYDELYKKMNKK